MTASSQWKVLDSDVHILRGLAKRFAEMARAPLQAERRRLWLAHNALRGERAMVLIEHEGIQNELGIEAGARCAEEWARGVELELLGVIWHEENCRDDRAIEPWFNIKWKIAVPDYGVDAVYTHGNNEGRLGSYHWEAPIEDLDRDFAKLRPRAYSVDREGTFAWKAHLESVFGDILPVRIRGNYQWSSGLTWDAIRLVGLEGLMLAMYDNPNGLHRLMAFLRDEYLAFWEWLERENLLSINNANDYIGSGSSAYTDELPQADWREGKPVRLKDRWVLCESQETVGVGPDLFEEFVFAYQLPIVKRFGLTYYGCCEPVHSRWHVLERIANLRKVSVSPWANEEFMADALAGKYVYCRKPNPAQISTERFDEAAIREDLRKTLRVTKGRNVELVMKDVHTVDNDPSRLARWVDIARETIEENP